MSAIKQERTRKTALAQRTELNRQDMRRLCRLAEEQQGKLRGGRFWRQLDFLISLAFLAVIALGIRAFLLEPVRVDGDSMAPTLLNGERMFVEKVSHWFGCPERGDIIICYYPGYTETCVKRVIATAGETVAVRDGTGYIDGAALDESAYWNGEMLGDFGPITVPEGEVFVMGDNRNASKDSRNPSVGTIPFLEIVGRVRAVILPLGSARTV